MAGSQSRRYTVSLGLHAACGWERRQSTHTFSSQTLEWKQWAFSGLSVRQAFSIMSQPKLFLRVLITSHQDHQYPTQLFYFLFFFKHWIIHFYSVLRVYVKYIVSTQTTSILLCHIQMCFRRHISKPAGISCFVLGFFFSRLFCVFVLIGRQVWSVFCLPVEINDEFNVESQQQQNIYSILEKKKQLLLTWSAYGPYFIFRETYCLNPYQTFQVWLFELLLLIISNETPALHIFHKNTISNPCHSLHCT